MTARLPLVYNDDLVHALRDILTAALASDVITNSLRESILDASRDLAARAHAGSELTLSSDPPPPDDDTTKSFTLPFQLREKTPPIVITSTRVMAGGRILWQFGRPKPGHNN